MTLQEYLKYNFINQLKSHTFYRLKNLAYKLKLNLIKKLLSKNDFINIDNKGILYSVYQEVH